MSYELLKDAYLTAISQLIIVAQNLKFGQIYGLTYLLHWLIDVHYTVHFIKPMNVSTYSIYVNKDVYGVRFWHLK